MYHLIIKQSLQGKKATGFSSPNTWKNNRIIQPCDILKQQSICANISSPTMKKNKAWNDIYDEI